MSESTTNLCPVLCFTCGRVVAHRWNDWVKMRIAKGWEPAVVRSDLDEMGFDRYCCRRMLLSHTEQILDTSRARFVQHREEGVRSVAAAAEK